MNNIKELSHLASLEKRHADLDKKISQGYSSYLDDEQLAKMKHEKLIIKRQIEEFKNQIKDDVR